MKLVSVGRLFCSVWVILVFKMCDFALYLGHCEYYVVHNGLCYIPLKSANICFSMQLNLAGPKLRTLASWATSQFTSFLFSWAACSQSSMHMCSSRIKKRCIQRVCTQNFRFSLSGFLLSRIPTLSSVWMTVADPNSVLLQVFYESFSQPAWCQLQPVIWLKAVKMENTFHAVSS